MPKKKVIVQCEICNKQLRIEISPDVAKDREFYPFEYIYVHGEPEHAIMLFLDEKLRVRDKTAYQDLNIAKKKKKELQALVRMSEMGALSLIYNDPLRLKVLKILGEGPKPEDELIDALKDEEDFSENDFNTLLLPFIKIGLVRTSWLPTALFDYYFLLKDFVVIRIPPTAVIQAFSNDFILKPVRETYLDILRNSYNEYMQRFESSDDAQVKEIQTCLEILSKWEDAIKILRERPKTLNELGNDVSKTALRELINLGVITEIKSKVKKYYALLCDIKIEMFVPRYIFGAIATKLNNKEVSMDIATRHLELLYEGDNY